MRIHLPICATLVAAALLPAQAAAVDLPKRKSGLWEIKTMMPDMPAQAQSSTVQLCVDEKSDDLSQQAGDAEAKKYCSKNEIRREGERYVVHSVCEHDKMIMTTDGAFSGKFDSAYRAEMKVTYSPPIMGMASSRINMEAKWLGPCKPGQKAGDMFVNGVKMNPQQAPGRR